MSRCSSQNVTAEGSRASFFFAFSARKFRQLMGKTSYIYLNLWLQASPPRTPQYPGRRRQLLAFLLEEKAIPWTAHQDSETSAQNGDYILRGSPSTFTRGREGPLPALGSAHQSYELFQGLRNRPVCARSIPCMTDFLSYQVHADEL